MNLLNKLTIKNLKLNKEQRLQMAKKSREIAESLFDAEKFVNAYITLIEG